ncbi:hypothetical protein, partial [Polymorphobacter multimanifer]
KNIAAGNDARRNGGLGKKRAGNGGQRQRKAKARHALRASCPASPPEVQLCPHIQLSASGGCNPFKYRYAEKVPKDAFSTRAAASASKFLS